MTQEQIIKEMLLKISNMTEAEKIKFLLEHYEFARKIIPTGCCY